MVFSEQVDSHDLSYGQNGPVDQSVPLRESSLKSSKANNHMLIKACDALKRKISYLKKIPINPQIKKLISLENGILVPREIKTRRMNPAKH